MSNCARPDSIANKLQHSKLGGARRSYKVVFNLRQKEGGRRVELHSIYRYSSFDLFTACLTNQETTFPCRTLPYVSNFAVSLSRIHYTRGCMYTLNYSCGLEQPLQPYNRIVMMGGGEDLIRIAMRMERQQGGRQD